MRFVFCGGLDCPDWVLAEIITLSKLSSVRIKLLCVQVINEILSGSISYEKVYKLTSGGNFESGDIKASVAALYFIIRNSAKFDVDPIILSKELQQLGLPKEHCDSLIRPYKSQKEKLRNKLSEESLRINRIEKVDWRVDLTISTHEMKQVLEPSVQLKIKTNEETISFGVNKLKLKILLNDLLQAKNIMEMK
ncbi:comm domain-containing protein [Anaeramoeba flamelloides]|uniref:Comm domain-containing protein n=1 Tax=Anaeramoeba flamelloides TaxID=1746091 RepID=A0ABQ8X4Z0_9EUKA|nr:comm domain-containing protein [Anaeramoeba flamelloides]